MAYQYVREPLTQEDADRLANACETTQEKLIIWPLLDCGLRISELCGLTPKHIQWQQRCLRIKGKGGPHGTKSKIRVVPMSVRVRAIFEPYFALNNSFHCWCASSTENRQAGRQRSSADSRDHAPRSSPHIRDDFLAERRLDRGSQENPRPSID